MRGKDDGESAAAGISVKGGRRGRVSCRHPRAYLPVWLARVVRV
jgi:hypothetical protein